jgi:hypothetical protein
MTFEALWGGRERWSAWPLLLCIGCTGVVDDPPGDTETTQTETTSADPTGDTQSGDGWFDVGWGDTSFAPLSEGDDFKIVWGGQGAAMFPMPIRGGGFILPDDPKNYLDERAPILDLHVDIEGHNDGFGGHFKRIANYPVTFDILGDGSYEFIYVAIILPDDVDPTELEGLPAHLWVQLSPYEHPPIVHELDLTVTVDEDAPG